MGGWQIVSGGQTGVDRAALDAAIALGLPHGGWCPRGRRAEDGSIDPRYRLRETRQRDYAIRTERNICDSDATLILRRAALTGGTRLTAKLAVEHQRPLLQVDLDSLSEAAAADAIADWLARRPDIRKLNVAGPRESSSPGIYDAALRVLQSALRR